MAVTTWACPRCDLAGVHRADRVGFTRCPRCGWLAAVGRLRGVSVLVVFLRRGGIGQGRVPRIERAA